MYVIYALIDPRDNTVHYVGLTDDVYKRFSAHIYCQGGNFVKNAWITELRLANKMVIMQTLEEGLTLEEAQEHEAYWIRHYRMLKAPLKNVSKVYARHKTVEQAGAKAAQAIGAYVKKVTQPQKPASPEERERIISLAREGIPRRQMCKALGKGQHYYDTVKHVLDEEGL